MALANSATSAAAGLPVPGNEFGLVDVVRCYATLGAWEAAQALLDRTDLEVRTASDELAKQMIERGRRSEALVLIQAAPDAHQCAIEKLALGLVADGALAEARPWIEMIEDAGARHEAEVRLSLAQASTDPATAKQRPVALWQAALADTRQIAPALRQVNDSLVAIGQPDVAMLLIQETWSEAFNLDRLAYSLDACEPLVLKVDPNTGCGLFEGLNWCTAFLSRDRESRLRPPQPEMAQS
jgi:hypothetical protein